SREEQDQLAVLSHTNLAAAWSRGFFDDLATPYLGLQKDQNMRPDASMESLARLKPVFGKDGAATMTAGNSTPLSDGAATVLLSTDAWASEHRLPVLAHFIDAETAAVDYVHGVEGVLMARTSAGLASISSRSSGCELVFSILEAACRREPPAFRLRLRSAVTPPTSRSSTALSSLAQPLARGLTSDGFLWQLHLTRPLRGRA